ncbi:MAG: hypothetical protein CMK59_09930 [Proteobacteria bacterium]|nr:hypothetical protein [Pseudomonadota bacterium]
MLSFLLLSSLVQAHPFSKNEFSLRTSIKISEKGIVPLVALEVPIPIALYDIGAEDQDTKSIKKRKIKDYNKKQWDQMAKGLSFTLNGVPVEGEWLPIEHPANGKAAEGFFVYLLSFRPNNAYAPLNPGDEIIIKNQSYLDLPMVYTGSAYASAPYTIADSTAKQILGENKDKDLNDPERWSTDANLRTMVVTVGKK